MATAARKTNLRDHRDPVRSLGEAFPEFRKSFELLLDYAERTRARVLAGERPKVLDLDDLDDARMIRLRLQGKR